MDDTRKRQREQSPNRLTTSPRIPPSSPPSPTQEAPFSDVDVFDEAVVDEDVIDSYLLQDEEADADGEDLFGDNLDAYTVLCALPLINIGIIKRMHDKTNTTLSPLTKKNTA